MRTLKVQLLILALILLVPSGVIGQSSSRDYDEKVAEGIVKVNDLMVEKDREKALQAIDEVVALIEAHGGKTYQDTGEKLDRVNFFLSKFNWDRARRILKDTMEELGLEYKPTHP